MRTIIMGSDHAGYALKQELSGQLSEQGYRVVDVGCHGTDSVDYPDFARALANEVLAGETSGILICGTGIGMSIAANKVAGIRAALCRDEFEAQMSRNHNNANVLCLGARVLDTEAAARVVDRFLNSAFEGGRHARRVDKLESRDPA